MAEIRTHHIAYATARYKLSARVLAHSARRYGLNTRVYGPADAVALDLRARHPEIMGAARGGGYWLWKPHIIRDAMHQASDGDVVLYTDCAVVFAADPAPLIELTRSQPIVLFELTSGALQREWTKRDCFVLLDADTPEFWNIPQLTASFQLYRVGPEARAFVDALCEATSNVNVLTDAPNICGLPDLDGFRAHRHDQSVLTIMARKFGLPLFPDPSQWGPGVPRPRPLIRGDGIERPPSPYGLIFQQHRRRNNKVLQWYAKFALARALRRRQPAVPDLTSPPSSR